MSPGLQVTNGPQSPPNSGLLHFSPALPLLGSDALQSKVRVGDVPGAPPSLPQCWVTAVVERPCSTVSHCQEVTGN